MTSNHPKILLIDLPSEMKTALANDGFSVHSGTYGASYPANAGDNVRLNHTLPNFTEQEILFLSVHRTFNPTPGTGSQLTSYVTDSALADPRPLSMLRHKDDADRIRHHGGVFIVFASTRYNVQYEYHDAVDNWGFLSRAFWFEVQNDTGSEIKPDLTSPLGRILAKHLVGASFSCVFKVESFHKEWQPIAFSKYGNAVAGRLSYDGDRGMMIVLPKLEDPIAFAVDLLKHYLPDAFPALFPNVEGGRWVHRLEYEHPEVISLIQADAEIHSEAERKSQDLKKRIVEYRERNRHVYGLLTGTGSQLVKDVEQSLKALGFTNVVNVDETTSDEDFREDLQILDGSPAVLIEVKGISGLPTDDDLLTAGKYVALRMKEMKRTDVVALTIINYERHKPAFERTADPFRPVVITSAMQHQIGILTTWDLFRLLRGSERNHWPHSAVAPLFVQAGKVDAIPSHYEYLGKIHGFIEKLSVVGLEVEGRPFEVGDRLAYELPVDFIEEPVTSLQLNNADIKAAAVGQRVGIKTSLTKNQARNGVRVFRVSIPQT